MKTVHSYKELREIAGDWTTVDITNDYIRGADNFTLNYKGKSVRYQNDNILNVANCAIQYNGLGWNQFMQFNPHIVTA